MSKQGNHNDQSVFEMIVDGCFVVHRRRQTNVPITKESWIHNRLAEAAPGDAPQVSFLRMAGQLQKTDRPGPHNFTVDDGSASELWFNAHYEDVAIVTCEIIGSDRCQTERVWNDVLHTIRETMGQMSIPTSYTWPTEEPDGASHMQAGMHKVVQIFEWRILVPHDFGTRAQIECINTEVELQSQGGESATVDKTITQTL